MTSKVRTITSLFGAHKRLKVAEPTSSGVQLSCSDSETLEDGVLPTVSDKGEGQHAIKVSSGAQEKEAYHKWEEGDQIVSLGGACSSSKDEGSKDTVKPTMELSQEQKIRMELNKATACAKRNLRLCEDQVAEARAQGLLFPKLKSLLVEKSWLGVLEQELQKPHMEKLYHFVNEEAAKMLSIYPPPAKIFNALNTCPFEKVRVVIIGQDPYHGPGQAMGLCFSVEKGIKFPSSLLNIFKEIQDDVGCSIPSHGNLEKWAYQGVLLLNTVLTVREGQANSHAKKGWEAFTDAAIGALTQQRSGLVFLLWGNAAQEKARLIKSSTHHILKAAHPSGLSAHRGFFKCRHFSQSNKILEKQGLLPIDWQI